MRNFFALVFLFPFLAKNFDKIVKTKAIGMHFARGLIGFIGMVLWFYVITLIPLSEAVAISFLLPISTTIAAIFFLKEKVDWKVWISLFIGFVGVLIIIRPGFREFNIAYLLAIIAPFIWSISQILIKKMVKTESPETITLYLSLVMLTLSIPFAIPYLKPISPIDWLWFILLGLVSNYSYICNVICYSKADVSVMQPFDFSRLIFTAIIAHFAFGEKVDLIMFIGALVILCGSLIVIPRKSKFARFRSKILKRRKSQLLPTLQI